MFRPLRFRGRTRELLSLAILGLLHKQTFNCRGRESWNYAGLTNTDKRVAGKKRSTNKYRYRPTSAGEKSNAPWDGLVDLWRCGRTIASTWFGLRHARLKVVVLQRTVVSSLLCSIFEFWVLYFRDLGASYFGPRCRVLRFQNYL